MCLFKTYAEYPVGSPGGGHSSQKFLACSSLGPFLGPWTPTPIIPLISIPLPYTVKSPPRGFAWMNNWST